MSTWFSAFSHFVYSHPYIVLIFLLFFAGSLVLRNRYYVKTTKENLNYVLSWFSLLIPYACAICLDVDFVHNNILAAALPFMDSVCDFISLSEYLQKEPIIFIAEVAKVFVLSVAIEIVKNIFEKVFNKPERSSVKSFFLGVIPWYLGLFISVAVVIVTNFILSLVFDKISVNSIYHIYLGIFIICTIMFISYILLLIIKIFLAPLIPYVMPLIETIKRIFFINTTGKILKKAYSTTVMITFSLLISDLLGILSNITSIAIPITVFIPIIIILSALFYITWVFC